MNKITTNSTTNFPLLNKASSKDRRPCRRKHLSPRSAFSVITCYRPFCWVNSIQSMYSTGVRRSPVDYYKLYRKIHLQRIEPTTSYNKYCSQLDHTASICQPQRVHFIIVPLCVTFRHHRHHCHCHHTCLVTANNGLNRHHLVSFEPKVCLFFVCARF